METEDENFGHITRTDNFVVKAILLKDQKGKGEEGKLKRQWLNDIQDNTGQTIKDLKNSKQKEVRVDLREHREGGGAETIVC